MHNPYLIHIPCVPVESSLWLPLSSLAIQNSKSTYPQQIGIYIKHSELAGNKLTLAEIDNIVGKYPGVNIILNAIRLNYILTVMHETDPATQLDLVKELLPEYVAKFISIQQAHQNKPHNFSVTDVRPVFTSLLTLQLIKRVLLHHSGLNEYEHLGPVAPKDIGTALSAISDHITTLPVVGPANERSIYPSLVRNHCFQDHLNTANLVLRFHSLLFETPHLPSMRAKNTMSINFLELFEQAAGIPMDLYFALGFKLLNAMSNPHASAQQAGMDWLDMCQFQWDKTITPMNIDKKYKSILKNTLTMTLNEARLSFSKRELEKSSLTFDFSPFVNRPILELIPNSMTIPVLGFTKEKFSDGMFHKVANFLKANTELQGKFHDYWGHLIEEYGKDLFKQYVAPDSPISPYIIDGDKPYKVGKKPDRSTDLICYVEYPHSELFLIDFTKSFFSLDSVIKEDNRDAVENGMKKLIDKAEDIHRTISNFKRAEFTIPGVDPEKVKVFRPVIVSTRTFPLNEVTWNGDGSTWLGLLKALASTGSEEDRRIRPLRLLDMTEFENLCFRAKKGESFFNTLRDWSNDSALCNFSLQEYWYYRNLPFSGAEIGLQDKFEEIDKKCSKILNFPNPKCGSQYTVLS